MVEVVEVGSPVLEMITVHDVARDVFHALGEVQPSVGTTLGAEDDVVAKPANAFRGEHALQMLVLGMSNPGTDVVKSKLLLTAGPRLKFAMQHASAWQGSGLLLLDTSVEGAECSVR